MALRIRTVPLTEAEIEDARRNFLEHYSDKFLACRADHHDWPVMVPGRKKIKGISGKRLPDEDGREGVVLIKVTCNNCGRSRWKVTGNHGVYVPGDKWHYENPPEFSRGTKGLGLTRHDYAAELYRRMIFE